MKVGIKPAAVPRERPQSRPAICVMAALLGVAIAAVPVFARADNSGVTAGSHVDRWWWHHFPYLRSTDGVPDDRNFITKPFGPGVLHYCLDPAGYYPTVTKCAVPWQSIDINNFPVEPVPSG